MRAAVLYGPRDLRVQATPTPEPGTGEVLVRVTLAGLCGTDHRIWSGKRAVHYPRVMGHELVGRLTETGERVVIEPNFSCGGCALCREGNRNLCSARGARACLSSAAPTGASSSRPTSAPTRPTRSPTGLWTPPPSASRGARA